MVVLRLRTRAHDPNESYGSTRLRRRSLRRVVNRMTHDEVVTEENSGQRRNDVGRPRRHVCLLCASPSLNRFFSWAQWRSQQVVTHEDLVS